MSLKIIQGGSGSGKSTACIDEIIEAIDSGFARPLILVVPEQFSLSAEQNIVRRIGRGAARVEILSFKRMAYRYFANYGGLGTKYINSAGKSIIMGATLRSIASDLEVLADVAKNPEFAQVMCGIVAECKRYGVDAPLVEYAADTAQSESLRQKMRDIHKIYRGFESAFSSYKNADDDLDRLAAGINSAPCDMFDGAKIWIDEFGDFTPQELSVVSALMRHVEQVTVALCIGELQSDIFDKMKKTALILKRVATKQHIDILPTKKLDYQNAQTAELAHLSAQLYNYPPEKYSGNVSNVSLVCAADAYDEVCACAMQIVSLCRDKNMRYRDIVVVARDAARYESAIATVFLQYNISYFLDKKSDIINHPLVMTVLSACDIVIKGWRHENIFRYLKSGFAIDRNSVDILENFSLESGMYGDRWTNDQKWARVVDTICQNADQNDIDIGRVDKLNGARNEFVPPLLKMHKSFSDSSIMRDMASALYELLCDTGAPDILMRKVEKFKQDGEQNLAAQYEQVWGMLVGVLDQVVECVGEQPADVEFFVSALMSGLAECEIGAIPPSVDSVVVGSADRMRSNTAKVVYILGANSGIFPANGSGEGILSDADRHELSEIGIELAHDTRTKLFDENLLVHQTFALATSRLFVSYAAADADGEALHPSHFVGTIRRILPAVATVHTKDISDINKIHAPAPTFNMMLPNLRTEWGTTPEPCGADASGQTCTMNLTIQGQIASPSIWFCAKEWFMSNDAWRTKCERALLGFSYRNELASVSASNMAEIGGASSSVTRLEKYAACKFAYFAKYIMGAKERKIYQVSALDFGNFAHRVLEEFSRQVAATGAGFGSVTKQQCRELVAKIVNMSEPQMSKGIYTGTARFSYFKDKLENIVFTSAWVMCAQFKNSKFEPHKFEATFQKGGDFDEIELKLSDGSRISLGGKIDRLDTLETPTSVYVRIVDYKSGSKKIDLSDVYAGLSLQLPTYLTALCESEIAGKPVVPAGVLYFRVQEPMSSTDEDISDDAAEQKLVESMKMSGLLLSDMHVLSSMDDNLDSGGRSSVINVSINKDGSVSKLTRGLIDRENFAKLMQDTKSKLIELYEGIYAGDFGVLPYKKGSNERACTFCEYPSVCAFDVGNEYRLIK